MFIHALQKLHLEMRKLDITVDVFELTYNDIVCDVIFDTNPKNTFSLTFMKKAIGTTLKLSIVPKFDLQVRGTNYLPFLEFFKIQKGNSQMAVNNFSEYLERHIPNNANFPTTENKKILAKLYDVEDADKIYYDSYKNWDKARAKNPGLKMGRTTKNLMKTKLLYPQIFEAIKDYDISINYSTIPRNNEKELLEQLRNTPYL
ncbi:hypothetical protein LHM76_002736 [Listeria monocytogenes]|nr:hypothetical protein [Listeria monocytogenes]